MDAPAPKETAAMALQPKRRLLRSSILANTAPTHGVVSMQLVLQGAEDVRRRSMVEVEEDASYDANNGMPLKQGIMSPYLGAEGEVVCSTCGNGFARGLCVGHSGHMELEAVALHPQQQTHAAKLLTCVCIACGACLVPQEHRAVLREMKHKARLYFAASKSSRRRKCPFCDLRTQPTYTTKGEVLQVKAKWVNPKFSDGTGGEVVTVGKGAGGKGTGKGAGAGEEREMGEEEAYFRDLVENFSNETALRVLRMAKRHAPEHNVFDLLELNVEPDAIFMTVLTVTGKGSRPTRVIRRRHLLHDTSRRLLFIEAPNKNLRHLRQLRAQLQSGEITPAFVRDLLRGKTNKPPLQLIDENIEFNRQDLLTQIFNMYNSKSTSASLPMQRRKRNGEVTDIAGSVKDFLDGKYALVRRHLRSGVVNQVARAPIGPTPSDWRYDEVGVPRWVAVRLTKPRKVTTWNKAELQRRICFGAMRVGGANLVDNPRGGSAKLDELNVEERADIAERLDVGWTVHVTMEDGDYAIINREPTLHMMNLMAFRVRIHDKLTIWMNHIWAKHYNFDYDGDEVALHFVQSWMAVVEAQQLMRPQDYIISPTSGTPIPPTLNPMLGVFFMTGGDTAWLDRPVAALLVASIQTFLGREAEAVQRTFLDMRPGEDVEGAAWRALGEGTLRGMGEHRQPFWHARQIFGLMLPRELYYGPRELVDGTGAVHIVQGELQPGGRVNAKFFKGRFSAMQAIATDFGSTVAAVFISMVVHVSEQYLWFDGRMSVCAGDILQSPAMAEQAQELVRRTQRAMAAVDGLRGTVEDREAARAQAANSMLTAATELVLNHVGDVDSCTPRAIIESGTKGSLSHMAQMLLCVGQQNVHGRRVFVDRDSNPSSSLPCFDGAAHPPEAHGLIATAYGSVATGAVRDPTDGQLRGGHLGPTPAEYNMHVAAAVDAMNGISCGVPQTGAMHRAFAAGGEVATVAGNSPTNIVFTDRDDRQEEDDVGSDARDPHVSSMVRVLQFAYGGNGMAVNRLEHMDMAWLYDCGGDEGLAREPRLANAPEWWIASLIRYRRLMLEMHDTKRTEWPLAFSGDRIVRGLVGTDPSLLNRADVVRTEQVVDLVVRHFLKPVEALGSADADVYCFLPHLCEALWHMTPAALAGRCTCAALRDKLEWMVRKVVYALDGACTGTSVALIASCSVSEANTQAQLDKFHHVGREAKAAISCLQRLRELQSAAANTKAPITTLCPRPDTDTDRLFQCLQRMGRCMLREVLLEKPLILFCPSDVEGLMSDAERAAWVESWELFQGSPPPDRFVLALRIDKAQCEHMGVLLDDAVQAVECCVWQRGSRSACPLDADDAVPADATQALVVSTRPDDDEWTLMVSMRNWLALEPLLSIDGDSEFCPPAEDDGVDLSDRMLFVMGELGQHLQRHVVLKGEKGIGGVQRRKVHQQTGRFDAESGSFVQQENMAHFELDGILSIPRLVALEDQGLVDVSRCVWNNLGTVFKTLGIEAARAMWVREMDQIIDDKVSRVHLELMGDMVCNSGTPETMVPSPDITSNSFMASATYSHTTHVMGKAAFYQPVDKLRNATALLVGQPPTNGTNAMGVRVDEEYLRDVASRESVRILRAQREGVEVMVDAPKVAGEQEGEGEDEEVVHVPIATVTAQEEEEEDDDEVVCVPMMAAAVTVATATAATAPAEPVRIIPSEGAEWLPPNALTTDFVDRGMQNMSFDTTQSPVSGLLPEGARSSDFERVGDVSPSFRITRAPRRHAHNSAVARRLEGGTWEHASDADSEDEYEAGKGEDGDSEEGDGDLDSEEEERADRNLLQDKYHLREEFVKRAQEDMATASRGRVGRSKAAAGAGAGAGVNAAKKKRTPEEQRKHVAAAARRRRWIRKQKEASMVIDFVHPRSPRKPTADELGSVDVSRRVVVGSRSKKPRTRPLGWR